MTLKIQDEELLDELSGRFKAHKQTLIAQEQLISQLNSVNEKLIASESLKTNFLSNIRNEINNPITAILELSRSIHKGDMDPEGVKKFAGLIHHEVSKLDFQLKNILFAADIEAGESPLSIISVNIGSLVSTIIDSFRVQLEKKEMTVAYINEIGKNAMFNTDPEKLHLIISNLFSNAIQFSHTGGIVEIESGIIDGDLVVSVSDSGIGISEENKNKIYDRFRQLELGSTKNYGGHGLGLSVSKALLEMLDGEINIESELNAGSSFSIKLKEKELCNSCGVVSFDGNDLLFNEADGQSY